MDTGLEYEGEAARKRFIVYWLRPAVAALAFGLFTFMVVSIPSEKEKIQLRGEVQRLRQEAQSHQAQLREMLPLANASRAERLTTVLLGTPGDAGGWGHVLYDASSKSGVVVVHGLAAEGQRGFCWWLDLDRKRHPLAAIDLTDGSGYASIRVPDVETGSFVITLESPEGEPSESSAVVLEQAVY